METLREEEVLRLEEALLRKMEERLTPLMEQAARDAARMAMQRLRLDMMAHISRHEETIQRLDRAESCLRSLLSQHSQCKDACGRSCMFSHVQYKRSHHRPHRSLWTCDRKASTSECRPRSFSQWLLGESSDRTCRRQASPPSLWVRAAVELPSPLTRFYR